MKILLRIFWAGLCLSIVGCSSTRDWNPFIELSEYTTVVVEDFDDPGNGVGRALADQLASELVRLDRFARVLRERDGSAAIVLNGSIHSYDEGNVAARIKYGSAVGNAKIDMTVVVSVDPGREYVGSFSVSEGTLMTGPDAARTGREDIDWVRQQAIRRIVQELEKEW